MYATPFASIAHAEEFIRENNLKDRYPTATPRWGDQEYDVVEGVYFINIGVRNNDNHTFLFWGHQFIHSTWDESLDTEEWNRFVANRTREEWRAILNYHLPGAKGPYWPEGVAILTRMAIAGAFGTSSYGQHHHTTGDLNMGSYSNIHAELSISAPHVRDMLDEGLFPPNAADELSQLVLRLNKAEVDFCLNNGEVLRLGLGTRITNEDGETNTLREWLNAVSINEVEMMLATGVMLFEGYELEKQPECLYSCLFKGGFGDPIDGLTIDRLIERLSPLGTDDEDNIRNLEVNQIYTTMDGQVNVVCYASPFYLAGSKNRV